MADNKTRARRAARALDAYAEGQGVDRDSALVDLLTDLMHWADAQDIDDFARALETARLHHQAEVDDAADNTCYTCGASLDYGDGYGGECGTCADRREANEEGDEE